MKKLLIVLFSAVLALCAHAGVTGKFFAYRSFWPETGAMKQFADIGVDLYAVMPSNSFNSLGEPYCKFPPSSGYGTKRTSGKMLTHSSTSF